VPVLFLQNSVDITNCFIIAEEAQTVAQ